MPHRDALLDGLLVLDVAAEPGRTAARILGDLGARVVRVAGDDEEPSLRGRVWDAGKERAGGGDLDDILAAADVVVETPYEPGARALDPATAPEAVWVSVTPIGLDGPRARWRATDLGPGAYERNGFRLSDAASAYDRPSPLLGQHTDEILGDILGLSAAEREALAADGVLD